MVDTTFVIAVMAAIAVALCFILWPLLRRMPSDSTAPPALILGIILLVPAVTFTLYRAIGTPEGLHTPDQPVHELGDAIAQLTRRLEREPGDIDGWLLLGLSYKRLEQFRSAEQALYRAAALDENNAHVKVELAETILFAREQQRMPTESRLLLKQAIALDPKHQKGLWLLGIDAFQEGDFAAAADWWQRLDTELGEGSVRDRVRAQIARARELDGLPPDDADPRHDQDTTHATITVTVSLAPELRAELSGQERVFVYASAIQGPAMPVAIQRLRVDDLPATVQLSDADAMLPEMRLSQFPLVRLTARVSPSGNATAQPGDLQALSDPVPVHDNHHIVLAISERLN